jgi:hypothetical protein
MSSSNEKDQQFLKTIHAAMLLARERQDLTIEGLKVGAPVDRRACKDYIDSLEKYLNAGYKMVWACQIAYGEGSAHIAEETMKEQVNN